jgi:hypothetical protein
MACKPTHPTPSELGHEDTIFSKIHLCGRRCFTSTVSEHPSEYVHNNVFPASHTDNLYQVVHALGHGAYGTFESYGDFSNITNACFLQEGAVSEVFTRFSVVVASVGGAESGRDTHGFATKIYSQCGNQDFVGNHLSSFFINDGANFPDLIHAVKYEADKGFPTGGVNCL